MFLVACISVTLYKIMAYRVRSFSSLRVKVADLVIKRIAVIMTKNCSNKCV